jgi:hypothetical protein
MNTFPQKNERNPSSIASLKRHNFVTEENTPVCQVIKSFSEEQGIKVEQHAFNFHRGINHLGLKEPIGQVVGSGEILVLIKNEHIHLRIKDVNDSLFTVDVPRYLSLGQFLLNVDWQEFTTLSDFLPSVLFLIKEESDTQMQMIQNHELYLDDLFKDADIVIPGASFFLLNEDGSISEHIVPLDSTIESLIQKHIPTQTDSIYTCDVFESQTADLAFKSLSLITNQESKLFEFLSPSSSVCFVPDFPHVYEILKKCFNTKPTLEQVSLLVKTIEIKKDQFKQKKNHFSEITNTLQQQNSIFETWTKLPVVSLQTFSGGFQQVLMKQEDFSEQFNEEKDHYQEQLEKFTAIVSSIVLTTLPLHQFFHYFLKIHSILI